MIRDKGFLEGFRRRRGRAHRRGAGTARGSVRRERKLRQDTGESQSSGGREPHCRHHVARVQAKIREEVDWELWCDQLVNNGESFPWSSHEVTATWTNQRRKFLAPKSDHVISIDDYDRLQCFRGREHKIPWKVRNVGDVNIPGYRQFRSDCFNLDMHEVQPDTKEWDEVMKRITKEIRIPLRTVQGTC